MDATKRVPTELEARMLLRDVARRMEDERAIGEYLVRSPGKNLLVLCLGILGGIGVGVFLGGRGSSMELSAAIGFVGMIVLFNTIAIGQVARVTGALARTVERLRAEPPLPRAPSPPTGG